MRVLIVEDELFGRVFLQQLLKGYGTCDMATNGEEAVDMYYKAKASGEPYELICLDVIMPVMDGFEVLKTIRESEEKEGISKEEKTKIVMTTALKEEKDVRAAFELGCTVYCEKPIEPAKFWNVLRKLGYTKEPTVNVQQWNYVVTNHITHTSS